MKNGERERHRQSVREQDIENIRKESTKLYMIQKGREREREMTKRERFYR